MVQAYKIANGKVTDEFVAQGDLIKDFKGDEWLFMGVMPDGSLHDTGYSSYKIYARKPGVVGSYRFLFPSVFGLVLKDDGSLKDA